ncbi:MAG: PD40 domain-containing protein [Anaerolineae bacterium]|nr:PD40 domain-containing protein [Anaerolineae bacterium]
MKHLKKLSQLGMSIALAGLLLMLLTTGLWAANTYALTRVTTAAGSGARNSLYPSINSNGSKIAFYSDADFLGQGIADEQWEIWLYDTATMTVTRVTTAVGSGGRDSQAPSINSDGSKIAFVSDADFLGHGIPAGQYEIWLYDTATMTRTRVTTKAGSGDRFTRYPSINSDGSKIAFDSDADLLGQGIAQFQYEIWLYDTATMTLTRVTTASPSGRDSVYPSINSDGSKIAFYSDADLLGQGIAQFQYEIWLYDTATMTLTRVTTSGLNRDSQAPSINSDGSKIAFHSDADFLGQGIPDDQNEIWLYDTATMTLTCVTTSGLNRDSQIPSINSDGSKIAFHSDADFLGQGIPDDQLEIWLYDTATMTRTRVTTGAVGRVSWYPSINSDGSKIAFHSDADFLGQGIADDQYEIWLASGPAPVYLPLVIKN